MKNVIVNKIMKYVLLEDQLRSHLKKSQKNTSFEELSQHDMIKIAKEIIADASPSDLDEYSLQSAWRTLSDVSGKKLADDDTDPAMHIELIDTEQQNKKPNEVVINEMMRLQCKSCQFKFYVNDLSADVSNLVCPVDKGELEITDQHVKKVNKDRQS